MRLLGVDVGEREVRVAEAERLLGAPRLTGVRRLPLDALPALARRRPSTVLAALPAARASHRLLVLPFRDARRLAQTVPLELLGQLPAEPDDATVAFARLGAVDDGTAVLAAVARRGDVATYVAPLAAAGLVPARVDLAPLPAWALVPPARGDAALLVADGVGSAVSVRRAGRLAGLRALDTPAADADALAAETRWALAALGGVPPTIVLAGADARPALAAALATRCGAAVVPVALPGVAPDDAAACAVAVGLVLGGVPALAFDGGPRAVTRSLRRAAALAAAAAALALVDTGVVRHGLAQRDAMLVAAIHAEAAAALPEARLVAPRAELEAALAARAAGGGDAAALTVLRELSTRVPAGLRPDLDELAIDDAGVSLHGRLPSFDAVDTLRRALAASALLDDVTAADTRTTVDGRGVEFRLHAARRAGAAS